MAEALSMIGYDSIPVYQMGSFPDNQEINKSAFLEDKMEDVKDKQGILGKAWNGIKELTTLGVSESDCEDMLAKYNAGEVSFEEAVQYIEDYDKKQSNGSGLLSNIITGVASIFVATKIGKGASLDPIKSALYGGPTGSGVKTVLGIIDRATNDIEGDELNGKNIFKDLTSGFTGGTTSAVASGVGAGIKAGNFGLSIKNGIKCGIGCGAFSGATGYMTDVLLGDKEFDIKDLALNTGTSAAVSGVVGAGVGGAMFKASGASSFINNALVGNSRSIIQQATADATTSTIRKIGGAEVKDLLNIA